MLDLLVITWNVSPDIFAIGNFHLRWYSVLFVAGLFPVGYYIMRSFYKGRGFRWILWMLSFCIVYRHSGRSPSGPLPVL